MTTGPTGYARALVAEMLASIRQSSDTPLRFGIDAPRIAARALGRVESVGESRLDATCLVAALDRVVLEAVGVESRFPLHDRDDDGDRGDGRPEIAAVLAAWLSRIHGRLGAVHPLALHILGLRVDGEPDREVAAQLDLGLRLAQRITADLRDALTKEVTAR